MKYISLVNSNYSIIVIPISTIKKINIILKKYTIINLFIEIVDFLIKKLIYKKSHT